MGEVGMNGECELRPTGKIGGNVHFWAWGEPFEELEPLKRDVEHELGHDWCEWEIENLMRERLEIQSSLNPEFLKWFFENHVNEDPSKWDQHIGGMWDVYWRTVDNMQQTAERMKCLDQRSLPAEYQPIDVVYDSEYGRVHLWEERKYVPEFDMEMFSPYMQIWVFPPKEFLKEEMRTATEEGRMPGPKDETGGPSPEEVAEIKQSEEAMEIINRISNRWGGEAEAHIQFKDGDEIVMNMVMRINPDEVMVFEPVSTYSGTPDVTITAKFDYIYGLIRDSEERNGGHTEFPPWERPPMTQKIKEVVDGARTFSKIMRGIASDDISVSPRTALPKLILTAKDFRELMDLEQKDREREKFEGPQEQS